MGPGSSKPCDNSGVARDIEFRAAPAGEEPGASLIRAMAEEIGALYPIGLEAPGMPSATPSDLGPPGGTFLVGWRDGTAVCCGGVKRLPDGACEIKRMYVVPAQRQQGIARALLAALEDAARALGYSIARLDTGPKQPHAQAMYESAGYAPIGNFNSNPVASFWGEKAL
jgi:GNAT superfamily N-acetyltransferase